MILNFIKRQVEDPVLSQLAPHKSWVTPNEDNGIVTFWVTNEEGDRVFRTLRDSDVERIASELIEENNVTFGDVMSNNFMVTVTSVTAMNQMKPDLTANTMFLVKVPGKSYVDVYYYVHETGRIERSFSTAPVETDWNNLVNKPDFDDEALLSITKNQYGDTLVDGKLVGSYWADVQW